MRTDTALPLCVLALALAACSQSSSTEPPSPRAAPSATDPVAVAPQAAGVASQALPFAKIKGRGQTITILARGGDVRYRVEGERGDVIVADATLEELRDKAPEAYEIARSAVAGGPREIVDARVDLRPARPPGGPPKR